MPNNRRTLFLAAACGALLASAALAAEPAARPNFVLVMTDDQGWGDIGYREGALVKTPVLDRLAATGLRLDRFYAAAPVCSPTRGSFLTGRHPNRYGVFSWGYQLPPQEVTLAHLLRDAGYATGHFGKWHLGTVEPDSPTGPGAAGFTRWVSAPNFFDLDARLSDQGRVIRTQGDSSVVVVAHTLEFIREQARAERPFAAVVWFGSPHNPHRALPEDRAWYAEQPPAMQHYLGEITAIDRAMGQLLDGLAAAGVAENTLVWFTSDNGANTPGSNGGLRDKKATLWEGGIRVPGILHWPGKIRPRVLHTVAGTVDILPTVLDLAGLAARRPAAPLDGVSLAPLISGKADTVDRAGLGFWNYPAAGRRTPSEEWLAAQEAAQAAGREVRGAPYEPPTAEQLARRDALPGHAAWIEGDWKLHRLPRPQGEPRYELYHLADDLAETRDLAEAEPARVEKLRSALEAWQRSVAASLGGADYAGAATGAN